MKIARPLLPVKPLPPSRPPLRVLPKSGEITEEMKDKILTTAVKNKEAAAAKSAYEKGREEITAWMIQNKLDNITVKGESRTVVVTLENTAKSVIDINKLLEATGLTLEKLHELGILSTTGTAVSAALGANFTAQAQVAGPKNSKAVFKLV